MNFIAEARESLSREKIPAHLSCWQWFFCFALSEATQRIYLPKSIRFYLS